MNKNVNYYATLSDFDAGTSLENKRFSATYIAKTDLVLFLGGTFKKMPYNLSIAKPGDIIIKKDMYGDGRMFTTLISPDDPDIADVDIDDIIGIVVIEKSHTDDNSLILVSIDYMNVENPKEGDRYPSSMKWGDTSQSITEIQVPLGKFVCYSPGTTTIVLDGAPSTSATKKGFPTNSDPFKTWGLLTSWPVSDPTNISSSVYGARVPTDKFRFSFNGGYGSVAASPYLTDGSKNPDFHDTEGTMTYTTLCGSANTDKIISHVSHTGKITNVNTTGHYPAAECCRAYKKGNWYLPSIKELAYLSANFGSINKTRKILGLQDIGGIIFSSSTIGSSEYEISYARMSDGSWGAIRADDAYRGGYVLAFLKIPSYQTDASVY